MTSLRSMAILVSILTISAAFTYNEELATEHAAISFAATCSNDAINNWNVGYVSRNYPNIKYA